MAAVERISRRIAAITESATLAVDAKAKALKAQGADVIGFGAGEPDFPTPEHIVEAAAKAVHDPATHRYTAAAGLPSRSSRCTTRSFTVHSPLRVGRPSPTATAVSHRAARSDWASRVMGRS